MDQHSLLFATGIRQPEGPVLLPGGGWLVTEMAPERGCITRLEPDGRVRGIVKRTGRPNGLALGRDGAIWVAESKTPALLRLSPEGQVETFLTGCGPEHFLFPNDLAFGPDGCLYLTDSGISIEEFAPGGKAHPQYRSLMPDGRIYRIDVHTRAIEKIDSGLRFPNGIAFGPDLALYVNETLTGNVYRYLWRGDSPAPTRELFGNAIDPAEPDFIGGPDGMKFAVDGSLFVAVFGQGQVTVLNPDGSVQRRIRTQGRLPTNLAFGPPGSRTVYVTEESLSAMEAIQSDVDGLPLFN